MDSANSSEARKDLNVGTTLYRVPLCATDVAWVQNSWLSVIPKALGSISSSSQTGCGSACLWSQHSGSRGQKMSFSLSLASFRFETTWAKDTDSKYKCQKYFHGAWRDSSAAKNIYCSLGDLGSIPRTHSNLQLSMLPISEDLTSFLTSSGSKHTCDTQTYMQANPHTHKIEIIIQLKIFLLNVKCVCV